jgi:hypothetical protein
MTLSYGMKILTEKGVGIVSKNHQSDRSADTHKVRLSYENGTDESFYSSDLKSLLEKKQVRDVTERYKKVEEIRQKLSDIRGEIQDLINQDVLWKDWLSPSIGALTCVLESLSNASDEMKRHYRRRIKPLIDKKDES